MICNVTPELQLQHTRLQYLLDQCLLAKTIRPTIGNSFSNQFDVSTIADNSSPDESDARRLPMIKLINSPNDVLVIISIKLKM